MINVGEILKTIMNEYSLNQTQLSRAISCDYTNVSRWCNNVRTPDIATLEHILDTFGYELKITLKERIGNNKSKDFYKEKTYQQILNMTNEELIDYIFVTQDDFVIANICNIKASTLEYIPFDKQKLLIKDSIENVDRLALYFKIQKEYLGVELEMSDFIDYVKYHLENLSNLKEGMLEKVEYITFDTNVHNDDWDDVYYTLYNLKLLDKDRNVLPVSSDDIDGNSCPLDNELSNELGAYFMNWDGVELKLNY